MYLRCHFALTSENAHKWITFLFKEKINWSDLRDLKNP
jgi:hypothetical protein